MDINEILNNFFKALRAEPKFKTRQKNEMIDVYQNKMFAALIVYSLLNFTVDQVKHKKERIFIPENAFGGEILTAFGEALNKAVIWHKAGITFKKIIGFLFHYVGQAPEVKNFIAALKDEKLNNILRQYASEYTIDAPMPDVLYVAAYYFGIDGLKKIIKLYEEKIKKDINEKSYNMIIGMFNILVSDMKEELKYLSIELLLDLGPKFYFDDARQHISLLHVAISQGYPPIVKLLLEKKANPCLSIKKDEKITAFVVLGESSKIDEVAANAILDYLLEHTPDLEKANLQLTLVKLIGHNKIAVIQSLLEHMVESPSNICLFSSAKFEIEKYKIPTNTLGLALMQLPEISISKELIELFLKVDTYNKLHSGILISLASLKRESTLRILLELGIVDIWDNCTGINLSPVDFLIKQRDRLSFERLIRIKTDYCKNMSKEAAIQYFRLNDNSYYSYIMSALTQTKNYELIEYFLSLRADEAVVILEQAQGQSNQSEIKYNFFSL
jgi:hypothetical protein